MNNPQQHSQPLTLAKVLEQFKLWRAVKTSGERVPESLWKLIAQLLENTSYKRSMIGMTLGISTHQLRTKFPDFFKSNPIVAPTTTKKHKPFVQAPLDVLIGSPAQFTIERSNGTKLIFSAVTPEQFSLLIKVLVE